MTRLQTNNATLIVNDDSNNFAGTKVVYPRRPRRHNAYDAPWDGHLSKPIKARQPEASTLMTYAGRLTTGKDAAESAHQVTPTTTSRNRPTQTDDNKQPTPSSYGQGSGGERNDTLPHSAVGDVQYDAAAEGIKREDGSQP